MPRKPRAVLAAALLVAIALLSACSPGHSSPGDTDTLTVFVASSLADAFEELGEAFRMEHPDARLAFNYAGSSTLRTQLDLGARADVFASADVRQMELAQQAGLIVGTPQPFAANELVVITEAGSQQVQTLSDMAKPGLRLVLALPEVPAGAYARLALARMDSSAVFGDGFRRRVTANLASEETNVRQVLAKVTLGEADAGIVYLSDVVGEAALDVGIILIPPQFNVEAVYVAAVLRHGSEPTLAEEFVGFLESKGAQGVLSRHGFKGARR